MKSQHNVHIPVMGIIYTLDTPAKVSHLGINSTISLVNDRVIERLRETYSHEHNLVYEPISIRDPDHRAKRIQAFMNLMNKITTYNFSRMKSSSFEKDGAISRYHELLPDGEQRNLYQAMLKETDPLLKQQMQDQLRSGLVQGRVDANIMTKLDGYTSYRKGEEQGRYNSLAKSALRGYAMSDLTNSRLVLSAGVNPGLFGYIADFDDFFPGPDLNFKKGIILKVNDYQSALTQAKLLAKKGIWVSEYRIESGLNCGGHAFARTGNLSGIIFKQFKEGKSKLLGTVFDQWKKTMKARGVDVNNIPFTEFTAQGGILTNNEVDLYIDYYGFDRVGVGTLFLSNQETTNVTPENLELLLKAGPDNIILTDGSPVGIRYWGLNGTESEIIRQNRIDDGKPGSPCTDRYILTNVEFTDTPVCLASTTYITAKLAELELRRIKNELLPEQYEALTYIILSRACICHDLADGKAMTPGPSGRYVDKKLTLEEIMANLYGRKSIFNDLPPHNFIREAQVYVDEVKDYINKSKLDISSHSSRDIQNFIEEILTSFVYYRQNPEIIKDKDRQNEFFNQLNIVHEKLIDLSTEFNQISKEEK